MNFRSFTVAGLIIVSTALCSAQAADSSAAVKKEAPVSIMNPAVPEFLLEQPSRFASFPLAVVAANTPGSLNRWGMYSPEFFDVTSPKKIDLTAPWKLQLQRREENKTLYTILGSVQLGGTAYVLYRHLKKNGLK